MQLVHRSAAAQCMLLGLEHRETELTQGHNAAVVSSLYSWGGKKLPSKQMFYFSISSWTAALSVVFVRPQIDLKALMLKYHSKIQS